jgi:hypothetical protein
VVKIQPGGVGGTIPSLGDLLPFMFNAENAEDAEGRRGLVRKGIKGAGSN